MTFKAPNIYERNPMFFYFFFPQCLCLVLHVFLTCDEPFPSSSVSSVSKTQVNLWGLCGSFFFGEKGKEKNNEVNVIMLRRPKNHSTASFL